MSKFLLTAIVATVAIQGTAHALGRHKPTIASSPAAAAPGSIPLEPWLIEESEPLLDLQDNQTNLLKLKTAARRLNKTYKNVIILGEPGSDKDELIRNLIKKVHDGKVLGLAKTTVFYKVNHELLYESFLKVGENLRKLVSRAKIQPTIFIFDDFHELNLFGGHMNDQRTVFKMIIPYLRAGELQIIGTSSQDDFYSSFNLNDQILDDFNVVNISLPSPGQTRQYLSQAGKKYFTRGLSPEIEEKIIQYSERFDSLTFVQPGKALRLIEQLRSVMSLKANSSEPTLDDLKEAAAYLYGIDQTLLDPLTLARKVSELRSYLDQNLIGQDSIKMALCDLAKERFTNTGHYDRAVRALLAGPPGVGKTMMGMEFAKGLNLPYIRIEMNRYRDSSQAFREELASAIKKSQHSVFILDEIEKANFETQQDLLALLDNGVLTIRLHNRTTRLDFRKSIIIATTNAGQSFVRNIDVPQLEGHLNLNIQFREGFRNAIIKDGLSEPVLDRFTKVLPAMPLSASVFKEVLRLHLHHIFISEMTENYLEVSIENEDDFLNFVMGKLSDESNPGQFSGRLSEEILADFVLKEIASVKITNTLSGLKSWTVNDPGRLILTFETDRLVAMPRIGRGPESE